MSHFTNDPDPLGHADGDLSELEEVIACLGDDAAQLREENPEDERAANMDRAAALLGEYDAMRKRPAVAKVERMVATRDGTLHVVTATTEVKLVPGMWLYASGVDLPAEPNKETPR